MPRSDWLTTAQIKEVLTEETRRVKGKVADLYVEDTRLFARTILPSVREVRPRDKVQGGVAVRAMEEEVCVHPYLFRQVCTNGAIRAQALQTRQIVVAECPDPAEALSMLRDAIRACGTDEAFTASVTEMRSAQERQADFVLAMMPMVSRMPPQLARQMFLNIMDRFRREADTSLFGLMNAVTSVARDTSDPELRWRLEEFGGGVPVLRIPPRRPFADAVEAFSSLDWEETSWPEERAEARELLHAGR
jgi:hypothetical protein